MRIASQATKESNELMKSPCTLWVRYKGLLVLIAIFVLAAMVSPRTGQGEIIFLNPGNLTDMLRAIAPVAIMGLAMTLVILTAGIDLSVGSILALSSVIAAKLLVHWQPAMLPTAQIGVAIAGAITAGTLIGLANGCLIASLRIQPFIITLASMIGIRGMALWISNNERIGLGVGDDVAGRYGDIFSAKLLMIGIFLGLAVIFATLLSRTVFGRYVRAVGDNALAARYAGLPVRRVQMAVYGLSGMMAGVAGFLLTARTTTGDPNAGIASELDVIAVVVIGGTSLAGGKGSIMGTMNGILIIAILTNILGLKNVDFNMQLMLKALIIIVAVTLQSKRVRE